MSSHVQIFALVYSPKIIARSKAKKYVNNYGIDSGAVGTAVAPKVEDLGFKSCSVIHPPSRQNKK